MYFMKDEEIVLMLLSNWDWGLYDLDYVDMKRRKEPFFRSDPKQPFNYPFVYGGIICEFLWVCFGMGGPYGTWDLYER